MNDGASDGVILVEPSAFDEQSKNFLHRPDIYGRPTRRNDAKVRSYVLTSHRRKIPQALNRYHFLQCPSIDYESGRTHLAASHVNYLNITISKSL